MPHALRGFDYRNTEVRLREHGELRHVLGIDRVRGYTTLYRCLRRLHEEDLARLLDETIRWLPPPPAEGMTVALTATGLARGAICTFFVNRVRARGQGLTWRDWLKWVLVADVPRQLMLAQMAHPGPCTDEALLPALLQHARHLARFTACWPMPSVTANAVIALFARTSAH